MGMSFRPHHALILRGAVFLAHKPESEGILHLAAGVADCGDGRVRLPGPADVFLFLGA